MEIRKRNGEMAAFDAEKIRAAMRLAFTATNVEITEQSLNSLLRAVLKRLEEVRQLTVENVQDQVEQQLMAEGYYETAKAYILYREKRAKARTMRERIAARMEDPSLEGTLREIEADFDSAKYSLNLLAEQYERLIREGMSVREQEKILVKAAIELTTMEAPRWEYLAARLQNHFFSRTVREEMQKQNIQTFPEKLHDLADEGLYGRYILEAYSEKELQMAGDMICPERDRLFTYAGLELLLKRYVIHTRDGKPMETPQEMFLGIALHLAMQEKRDRMEWVQRFYDMLSRMEVTMATPTMANARKPFYQLSSCFVDVVPDSLDGIYRSIDSFAKVSKFGGGMGLYFGKVRASGSAIRGFPGAAGGVIRWIKLVNDTAVAVDQLGMRQGAVAVYLDVWHRDLPEFLQLRTNNGDDRQKAHDVFPAVCYPDLFWKLAEKNIDAKWYLMCPHEIQTVKDYALEDFWGKEWERRYWECVEDPRIEKRVLTVKEIVRLVLRSAVETGTPFAFNRDTVNRMNPNSHCGMIYCSNLCTEIAQNMAPVESLGTEVRTEQGDPVVVTTTKPGEFVVCNLASLSLGNLPLEDEDYMDRTVETAVRALDNVIDLNLYPVAYAGLTNRSYRGVGLGISGYHHALAKRHINWEKDAHLKFADKLFERINYAAIRTSCKLAVERGSYAHFEGSDWQTGAYFEKRSYKTKAWKNIAEEVQKSGMRNAYLLAIAPTSSTSILSGTSAGVDPVMQRFWLEEKKGSMLPRVAPELSADTMWYYKPAHRIDQTWSVKAAGIRQRHIDQAQSMNLYITNEYTMRQVLELYLLAWKSGVKTIYYVRSKSLEVTDCDVCSS